MRRPLSWEAGAGAGVGWRVALGRAWPAAAPGTREAIVASAGMTEGLKGGV